MKMGRTEYKAVIFDLGGVLVTDIWEPLRDWLVARYGLARPDVEAFGKAVVWDPEFACRPDHTDEAVLYDRIIRRFNLPITPDAMADRVGGFVRPIPGMMDRLRDLKGRGLTVGICSNNTEFWYARQRDVLGLEDHVDPGRIVLSCRAGEKKKNAKIFRDAVAAVETDAAACLFVDDRIKNVEAAAALGMTAVHLPDEIPFDAKQEHLRRQLAGIGLA
jgi:putative hydrolase of the HAD superfamily